MLSCQAPLSQRPVPKLELITAKMTGSIHYREPPFKIGTELLPQSRCGWPKANAATTYHHVHRGLNDKSQTRRPMDKPGIALGLATISVVGAALLFAAERVVHGPMNFIERHFGSSPDGGDGSMEILVVVALV